MDNEEAPAQETRVIDGEWAVINLRDEITDRAAVVANKLGMHFDDFLLLALEEKLTRMGLINGPGRVHEAIKRGTKEREAERGARKSSESGGSSSAGSSGSGS